MTTKDELRLDTDQRPFTMVYNDFFTTDKLTPYEKLVYICLKMHSDTEGHSFPSLQTIAKETGVSLKTVQRCVTSLQEKEFLKKKNRIKKNGCYSSNIYRILDFRRNWEEDPTQDIQELIKQLQAKGYEVRKKEGLTSSQNVSPKKEIKHLAKYSYQPKSNAQSEESQSQSQSEVYSKESLKAKYDYPTLINMADKQTVDAVIAILYDTLNSSKPTLRINSRQIATQTVKQKLLALDNEDILHAIARYNQRTDRINSPAAYMLTILYHAKEQYTLEINNQINIDRWSEV